MALARYRSDGTAYSTFHGDGRVERQVGQNDTRARAIALDRQGSIVIAGDIHSQSADVDFGFLARFLSTGAQDTGFSNDGLFLDVFGQGNTFQPGEPRTENSYVTAVAVDGSNRAVVVGAVLNREFAVARFRADGVPDTAFNGTGRTATGFVNAHRSLPTAVTVGQANGIITVVGGADGAFAVARFRDNGTSISCLGGTAASPRPFRRTTSLPLPAKWPSTATGGSSSPASRPYRSDRPDASWNAIPLERDEARRS